MQGSYRETKVLNILEFHYLIRVPLDVLEFLLNVLECSCILLLLGIFFFFALFIPASNIRGSITTSEEKQRSLLVGYHR